MIFNSLEFAIFLPLVFIAYWFFINRNLKLQNLFLLIASYIFYGWWDTRFLFLIVLSTMTDYCAGIMIDKGVLNRKQRINASLYTLVSVFLFIILKWDAISSVLILEQPFISLLGWTTFEKQVVIGTVALVLLGNIAYPAVTRINLKTRRKIFLLSSILVNIGLLGFFKYFNFFIDSFVDFSKAAFNYTPNITTLSIILPVGISFYTFQTLSYTIDIYRKKIESTNDFLAFAAFVSFFPQLVAGPIERASNLLPQFNVKRTFDLTKARDGMRQIIWGLFKKIVIADNIARYVNEIFGNSDQLYGSTLVLGVIYFAFQIYCDFSGYSDIAIGTARLFGFNLMQNFAFPYFSRDIAEFWRRWHISLSTWFRDYVYIPLGGSRVGNWMKFRNTMVIFVVSGFWHGANWTFIVWGFINALYYLPLMFLNKNRKNTGDVAEGRLIPGIRDVVNIGITFGLTLLAWIFFRAENLQHAFSYIGHIFTSEFFTIPSGYKTYIPYIILLLVVEWLQRTKKHALEIDALPRIIRWPVYYALIYFIFNKGGNQEAFIYFQF